MSSIPASGEGAVASSPGTAPSTDQPPGGAGPGAGPDSPQSAGEMLEVENGVLSGRPGRGRPPGWESGGWDALCLSGGGIRSATFGLGVLQGLAGCKLLTKVDYLSTVSGGGYIGSWLSAWASRTEGGIAEVERQLDLKERRSRAARGEPPDPPAVAFLRDYSNYLTPRLGLMSMDTWAAVATAIRNIVLIWTVLLPVLLAAMMLPSLMALLIECSPPKWVVQGVQVLGSALLAWSMISAGYLSETSKSWRGDTPRWSSTDNGVACLVLLPFGAALALLGMLWTWAKCPYPLDGRWFFGAQPALCASLIGAAVALWRRRVQWRGERAGQTVTLVMASAAIGGVVAWGGTMALACWLSQPDAAGVGRVSARGFAWLGWPTVLAFQFLGSVYFVGFMSRYSHRTEEDLREWWARVQGWMLMAATLWLVFAGISLYWITGLGYAWAAGLALLGGVSGVGAVLLAAGKWSAGNVELLREPRALRGLTYGLGAVFGATAAAGLAWLGDELRCLVAGWLEESWGDQSWTTPVCVHAGLVGGLLLWSIIAGLLINVNKFSLQAFYRNRLMRAYLGASRNRCGAVDAEAAQAAFIVAPAASGKPATRRHPNPFTGFDPDDNLAMSSLREVVKRGLAPLHVVNLALNLVHGKRLAWQERRAESFSVTPFHCGSVGIEWKEERESPPDASREQGGAGNSGRGAYRPANEYGGPSGISLGAAMAISGAAVSPNMGYHSSPAMSFLLTLFNVRLGWWLGNPASKKENGWWNGLVQGRHPAWQRPSPRSSLVTILAEAFGQTDDEHAFVYLSDGGHFENLGLYEMVLRRCRHIVVCDAGCDPACAYQDLGNAIRKARIDLGVEIQLERVPLSVRVGPGEHAILGAVGKILYPRKAGRDHDEGKLLYLKPVLDEIASMDVRNYGSASAAFPHESTVDQFFSESQFESYRALGEGLIRRLSGNAVALDMDGFFREAERALTPPSPKPPGSPGSASPRVTK